MAQKRMFSKKITNSEEFLEMPVTAQVLYFHLSMNADDDGFVQHARIMRMIGHQSKDDLKLLHIKGFLLPVADRVIVIKHWHINNTIRTDRYTPSLYKEHLKNLGLDDNKIYIESGVKIKELPDNETIKMVNHMETQYSIDKDSIEEDSIDSDIIFNHWLSYNCLIQHTKKTNTHSKAITKIVKEYDEEQVKQAITNYATVLGSDDYYFSHKWTLDLFLTRKNGLPMFLPEASPLENYRDKSKKSTAPRDTSTHIANSKVDFFNA